MSKDSGRIYEEMPTIALGPFGETVVVGLIPAENVHAPGIRIFAAGDGDDPPQVVYIGGWDAVAALRDLCSRVIESSPLPDM